MTEQWQEIDEQVKIACSPNATVEDLRKLRPLYHQLHNVLHPTIPNCFTNTTSNALNN